MDTTPTQPKPVMEDIKQPVEEVISTEQTPEPKNIEKAMKEAYEKDGAFGVDKLHTDLINQKPSE